MSYLLVALLFAFGLMAKPMVITLPFLLLLLDFWPLERFPGTPLSKLVGKDSSARVIGGQRGDYFFPFSPSLNMYLMAGL